MRHASLVARAPRRASRRPSRTALQRSALGAIVALLALGIPLAGDAQVAASAPPAATPVEVVRDGNRLVLRYDGEMMAEGQWDTLDARVAFQQLVDSSDGRITQVLKWTTFGGPIRLSLRINASDEAFPVQAEPLPRGIAIVRHAVGLSTSRLNRGVYDRPGVLPVKRRPLMLGGV
ncbi:MAG: hypothetical protein ABI910_19120, partial [Gemmatimonadota bacterium]